MQPMRSVDAVTRKGLRNDQAFGRTSRQVLLVDLDQLTTLGLKPGALRENITVAGLTLDTLPVGTRLKAGEVLLEIVKACHPCSKLEDIRPGLKEASEGIRGMLAVVERGGVLVEGNPIEVIEP